MRFKSAIDTWLWVVLAFNTALVGIALVTAARTEQAGLVAITVTAAVLLPLWIVFSTHYTVEEGLLRVRSGPFLWRIPLEAIRTVEPSRSWLSGPALSLNRLKISYGEGKAILVSPLDRDGFLKAIGRALAS